MNSAPDRLNDVECLRGLLKAGYAALLAEKTTSGLNQVLRAGKNF